MTLSFRECDHICTYLSSPLLGQPFREFINLLDYSERWVTLSFRECEHIRTYLSFPLLLKRRPFFLPLPLQLHLSRLPSSFPRQSASFSSNSRQSTVYVSNFLLARAFPVISLARAL